MLVICHERSASREERKMRTMMRQERKIIWTLDSRAKPSNETASREVQVESGRDLVKGRHYLDLGFKGRHDLSACISLLAVSFEGLRWP